MTCYKILWQIGDSKWEILMSPLIYRKAQIFWLRSAVTIQIFGGVLVETKYLWTINWHKYVYLFIFIEYNMFSNDNEFNLLYIFLLHTRHKFPLSEVAPGVWHDYFSDVHCLGNKECSRKGVTFSGIRLSFTLYNKSNILITNTLLVNLVNKSNILITNKDLVQIGSHDHSSVVADIRKFEFQFWMFISYRILRHFTNGI